MIGAYAQSFLFHHHMDPMNSSLQSMFILVHLDIMSGYTKSFLVRHPLYMITSYTQYFHLLQWLDIMSAYTQSFFILSLFSEFREA